MSRMKLNEDIVATPASVSYEDLPSGVIARVRYPICNIGKKNRNSRKYGMDVWDSVQADEELQERIRNRCCWGHSEHPENGSKTEFISHVVTGFEVSPDKKIAFCSADVLDTPYGRIVETLLRAKCGLGMSTRAEGEVESCTFEDGSKGSSVKADGFKMDTVDFTADPSTYGALPQKIVLRVVNQVKEALDRGKLKPSQAQHLLEGVKADEAKLLVERIVNNKGHGGCSLRLSERECSKCQGVNVVHDRFERMSKPELRAAWESFIKDTDRMSGSDSLLFLRALSRKGVLTESEAFVELSEARRVSASSKAVPQVRLVESAQIKSSLLEAQGELAEAVEAKKEMQKSVRLTEMRLSASEKSRKILAARLAESAASYDNACKQAKEKLESTQGFLNMRLMQAEVKSDKSISALKERVQLLQAELDEKTKKYVEDTQRLAEDSKKAVVNAYVEWYVSSGLKLTESQRALLADCDTTVQVDETIREIRRAIRESVPHLDTIRTVQPEAPSAIQTSIAKVMAGM